MAWSTRELADLAGTTVNTVRHYHRLGLLEVPARHYNGYKQYEVSHLVGLLRIRRLTDLGIPLAQIPSILAAKDPTAELDALDAEVKESIQRLRKVRKEIAALKRTHAPIDTPAGFEAIASKLSEADVSMIRIYSRVYEPRVMDDVREIAGADDDTDLGKALEELSDDADEETREALVQRFAASIAQNFTDYPWLMDPASRLRSKRREVADTVVDAVRNLYTPAQLDVLSRASILAAERVRANEALHDA